MADKVFTMRIDEELLEKVRLSAEKNCRSLAKEIEFILIQHFREVKKSENAYNSPEVDVLLNRLLELLKEHGSLSAEVQKTMTIDKA